LKYDASSGCNGVIIGVGCGIWLIIIGIVLSLTGIGAVIGIPIALMGIGMMVGGPLLGLKVVRGHCPYCGQQNKATRKQVNNGGMECTACKQLFYIRNKTFEPLAVYREPSTSQPEKPSVSISLEHISCTRPDAPAAAKKVPAPKQPTKSSVRREALKNAQPEITPTKANALVFQIQGGASRPYTVIFERESDNITARCSCPGGRFKSICKHRIALLNADVTNLVSDNHADVTKLGEMLIGTDVQEAYEQYRACINESTSRKLKEAFSD